MGSLWGRSRADLGPPLRQILGWCGVDLGSSMRPMLGLSGGLGSMLDRSGSALGLICPVADVLLSPILLVGGPAHQKTRMASPIPRARARGKRKSPLGEGAVAPVCTRNPRPMPRSVSARAHLGRRPRRPRGPPLHVRTATTMSRAHLFETDALHGACSSALNQGAAIRPSSLRLRPHLLAGRVRSRQGNPCTRPTTRGRAVRTVDLRGHAPRAWAILFAAQIPWPLTSKGRCHRCRISGKGGTQIISEKGGTARAGEQRREP